VVVPVMVTAGDTQITPTGNNSKINSNNSNLSTHDADVK
jgi:hypothetical protein